MTPILNKTAGGKGIFGNNLRNMNMNRASNDIWALL